MTEDQDVATGRSADRRMNCVYIVRSPVINGEFSEISAWTHVEWTESFLTTDSWRLTSSLSFRCQKRHTHTQRKRSWAIGGIVRRERVCVWCCLVAVRTTDLQMGSCPMTRNRMARKSSLSKQTRSPVCAVYQTFSSYCNLKGTLPSTACSLYHCTTLYFFTLLVWGKNVGTL